MVGKTMIVRFIALGPADSIFTILGLQCTDSWYVAHSESLALPTWIRTIR